MQHFFTCLLVSLSCAAFAQTIPNGDFESWVGAGADCENPEFWDSANESLSFFAGICTVEKTSTMVADGNTAARLETKNVGGLSLVAPAALALGTIVVDIADPFAGVVEGGVPTWDKATSLTFFYHYTPAGGDSMTVRVRMYDITGTDTTLISEDEFFTEVASTGGMEEVTLDINYLTTDEPELVQIIARSTRDSDDATPGSTLFLDGFRLNGITAVGDPGAVETPVMYPNPAKDFVALQVNSTELYSLQFVDLSGKTIYAGQLAQGLNTISTSNWAAGLTFYRIVDNSGQLVRSGKLLIQ